MKKYLQQHLEEYLLSPKPKVFALFVLRKQIHLVLSISGKLNSYYNGANKHY